MALNQATRLLYRGLARRARHFDRYPIFKAYCDRSPFSRSNYLPYVSFHKAVRQAFRKARANQADVVSAFDVGFNTLRMWDKVYTGVTGSHGYEEIVSTLAPPVFDDTETPLVVPIQEVKVGSVLISHPRTGKHKVVLIVRHNQYGTCGLDLNHRSSFTISLLPKPQSETEELSLPRTRRKFYFVGGPDLAFTVLHCSESRAHISEKVAPGLYWSGDGDNLREYLKLPSSEFRVFHGCTSWEPGYLQAQLQEGSWIPAQAPLDMLFTMDKETQHIDLSDKETDSAEGNVEAEEDTSIWLAVISRRQVTSLELGMWSNLLKAMGGEYYHFAFANPGPGGLLSSPETLSTST